MTQDDFEVLFCDLCNTSVPLQDVERGAAVRHQGKTIGACCLPALQLAPGAGGAAPVADVAVVGAAGSGVPAGGGSGAAAARPGGLETRLLPIAIVVLAAIAAATIYLDDRIAKVRDGDEKSDQRLSDALHGHGETLAEIDKATDATVRREAFDEHAAKVAGLEEALRVSGEETKALLAAQQQSMKSIGEQIGALRTDRVDHRPQLEELKAQLQRQATMLAELRAQPLQNPVEPAMEPPRSGDPAPPAVPGLPPELAHHVQKLKDPDPAVRFEAVDELLRSKNPLALEHLLPMAKDADTFVRRLTVDGLREHKHANVVETLLTSLSDPEELVRDAAWRSLKDVTGQKLPFDAAEKSKDARERAIQRWRDWWEKNRATFGA